MLEIADVSKSYGSLHVLTDVSDQKLKVLGVSGRCKI